MSGRTYVWADEGHTAAFEFINPPEPTLLNLIELQAEIDSLDAQHAVALAAVKSDADVRSELAALLMTSPVPSAFIDEAENVVAENDGLKAKARMLAMNRDNLQDVLNTVNAEATD